MSNKRALIVEPAGNLWGSERSLIEFLRASSDSTWEMGVCCPPNTPILEVLEQLPCKVFPCFISNLHLKGKPQRLFAAIRLLITAVRFKPHLIYVNQAGATRIALLVGRLLKVPVITHVRLQEDVEYVLSLRANVRDLPVVICISKYIQDLFPKNTSPSTNRVKMIYNPYKSPLKKDDDHLVDQANETVVTSGLFTMYDPYNLSPNKNTLSGDCSNKAMPIFSCVGRLTQIKGQDLLLHAIAILKREGIMVEGWFIGSPGPGDDFDSKLQKLSIDLEVTDQVTWHGFQKDSISHLSQCAAQVITSHVEPLGRVVLEAWDAGTVPVAWAGSGGAAEVIKDSGGGVLYERQDGESLAASLKLVLAMSQTERFDMIRRGREWLIQHCNPVYFTQSILGMWQEVIDRR